MYQYKAKIKRWIDGDSAVIQVDLGFRLTREDSFRLAGIDTPEMNSPDPADRERAWAAKALAEQLAPPGSTVTIDTAKDDKYGRWLAKVTTAERIDVAMELIANGLGRPYDGGAR